MLLKKNRLGLLTLILLGAVAGGISINAAMPSGEGHRDAALHTPDSDGTAKQFPDDYIYIDVTKPPYNADNTGTHDATEALNAAFTNNGINIKLEGEPKGKTYTIKGKTYNETKRGPIIYLPAGTYLVSDRIMPSYAHDLSFSAAHAWIQGAGAGKTIIKLKDNAPGYQNTKKPKPILQTGCSADNYDPKRGVGHLANAAYNNHVADLTIVSGAGNPGAIGLWYDAANSGVAENIVIDGSASGFAGITCSRVAGTGLLKHIEVVGFDYGVNYFSPDDVNNFVFEYITVRNQRKAGFTSLKKMTVVREFTSMQKKGIPAIQLGTHHAAMILLGAKIEGPSSAQAAIEINDGAPVYFRDIAIAGYKNAIDHEHSDIPDVGEMAYITDYQATRDHQQLLDDRYTTLRLPVRETPSYHPQDMSLWKNAQAYGVIPNDGKDDSDAIEKAINSAPAESVLYFPYGYYELHRDITIETKARKIDFCGSRFNLKKDLFIVIKDVKNKENEILFDNLHSYTGFKHTCDATLVVKNKWKVTKILSTEASKGDIILENLAPFPRIEIKGGNKLWAHSINGEVARHIIDNCMAWLFGVNNEMKARERKRKTYKFIRVLKPQIKAVNNSVVETYNIQDSVNHDFSWEKKITPKHDYFTFFIEDSTFSVAAAGAHRYFDPEERAKEAFTVFEDGTAIYKKGHSYINKVLKVIQNGEVKKELYHRDTPDSIYSQQSGLVTTKNKAERSYIVYHNAETPAKGEYYKGFTPRKTKPTSSTKVPACPKSGTVP